MKPIDAMTRKDFLALPHRKWDEKIECTDIVILPSRARHDSGYRLMDFVAIRNGVPVCLLSGCSDVVHLDGIGGFGPWDSARGFPSLVPPSGWSIDCLPVSGLLRIWPSSRRISCRPALSSFEIYALPSLKKEHT